MSLERVVEDIRDEARARATEIREEGDRRAEEILADAEDDAEEIVAQREREVERTIDREREQTLSSAKLEAKQQRLEARREMIQRVREQAETEIANIDGAKRKALTESLLDATVEEFGADATVEVYGHADDEALLTELLADYDGYSYAGEYDCLGGLVAESDASRVRVNNTFDSVLDSVWDDELKEISARLFDEDTPTP